MILAGGRGLRLAPYTDYLPKPMFQMGKAPFIQHQISQAKEFGFERVLILAGYLGETISNYYKDVQKKDIDVEVLVTSESLTTKQRLISANELLDPYFCLVYGDNLIQLLPSELNNFFGNDDNDLKFIAYAGKGYHSNRNILLDDKGKFFKYEKTNVTKNPDSLLNLGWYLISKSVLSSLDASDSTLEDNLFDRKLNLKTEVLRIQSKYYSVGSIDRLASLERFLDQKRRSIILDRDGTINIKAPRGEYVIDEKDFVWKKGVREVLAQTKMKSNEFYILTNQPAVGRNLASKNQINLLHKKLHENFIESQIDLKGVVTCYHGWNDGCNCRKPGVGLFFELQHDFDLNWKHSVYVGDQHRDFEAAEALGLSFIQVGESATELESDLLNWLSQVEKQNGCL